MACINEYKIGWMTAIPIEAKAASEVLDAKHEEPPFSRAPNDANNYIFGRLGNHNLIIFCLPAGGIGKVGATNAIAGMKSSFPQVDLCLLVGLAGGIPGEICDIRLGDVVVSQAMNGSNGGVIEYDFGKTTKDGKLGRFLNAPSHIALNAVSKLQTLDADELAILLKNSIEKVVSKRGHFKRPDEDKDRLFEPQYEHPEEHRHRGCASVCDPSKQIVRQNRACSYPRVHYGIIASGDQVIKHGIARDVIGKNHGAICCEMEAAGVVNQMPTLVIRGICDYSDSHKSKVWQPYAALAAAAYAKEVVTNIPIRTLSSQPSFASGAQEQRKYNVPFRIPAVRNSTFVGREDIINAIREFSEERSSSTETSSPRTFVIVGTGGMGKTQIAIEYAYRFQSKFSAIFWVNATTEDTLRESFKTALERVIAAQAKNYSNGNPNYTDIGRTLYISDLVNADGKITTIQVDSHSRLRDALVDWLSLPENKDWLVIVDNADDLEAVPLDEYLPKNGRGMILITSRREEFSADTKKFRLRGLERQSAVELLLRLGLRRETTEEDVREAGSIVDELGCLPLAISHAGHFIFEEMIELKEYPGFYKAAFMEVQSRRPQYGWQYRKSDGTVAQTWEASFKAVEKRDKEAVAILLASSFLDPVSIQETLWMGVTSEEDYSAIKADTKEQDVRTTAARLAVKRRIRLLASYSLIEKLTSDSFSIHPVVHIWARERMTLSEKTKALNQTMRALLIGTTLENNPEDHSMRHKGMHKLHGHLDHVSTFLEAYIDDHHMLSNSQSGKLVFLFFSQVSNALRRRHKHKSCISFSKKIIERFGNDMEISFFLLGLLKCLAFSLQASGRWDEAEENFLKYLAIAVTYYGPGDAKTLSVLPELIQLFNRKDTCSFCRDGSPHNCADLLRSWLFVAILNIDDADSIDSGLHLCTASLLYTEGKYFEAKRLLLRYFKVLERVHGRKDVEALRVAAELSYVYTQLQCFEKAEKWADFVLNVYSLGSYEFELNGPILCVLDVKAGCLTHQNRFADACCWYERSIKAHETHFGKSHSSSVEKNLSYASVLASSGQKQKALEYVKIAASNLDLSKNEIVSWHPTTDSSLRSVLLRYKELFEGMTPEQSKEASEILSIHSTEYSPGQLGWNLLDVVDPHIVIFNEKSLDPYGDFWTMFMAIMSQEELMDEKI